MGSTPIFGTTFGSPLAAAPMLLQSVTIRNTDTATARSWEFRLYVELLPVQALSTRCPGPTARSPSHLEPRAAERSLSLARPSSTRPVPIGSSSVTPTPRARSASAALWPGVWP